MNKTNFLKLVESQLKDVFKQAQLGTRDNKAKHQCEGFMQCGRVLGIVNDSDLTTLMEIVHKQVFNMTIRERKAEKLKLSKQREMDGYKELDIPAFLRDPNYQLQD